MHVNVYFRFFQRYTKTTAAYILAPYRIKFSSDSFLYGLGATSKSKGVRRQHGASVEIVGHGGHGMNSAGKVRSSVLSEMLRERGQAGKPVAELDRRERGCERTVGDHMRLCLLSLIFLLKPPAGSWNLLSRCSFRQSQF